MNVYQAPSISTIQLESFTPQLQYQPDCTGGGCDGSTLGALCNNFDEATASFFYPSNDSEPPCTLSVNDVLVDPANCNYESSGFSGFSSFSCSDGSGDVLILNCDLPPAAQDCDPFDIEVVCDGLSSSCTGITPQ
jgi:hypothetical protein